jgi:hypothetical protein
MKSSLSIRNNWIAGKQKIDRGHLGLFFYCVSKLDSKWQNKEAESRNRNRITNYLNKENHGLL